MAEKTLNVRFKQKYDTSTNWSEKNPILLAGEIGIESDTNKMKVGDGTTEWNNLEYISAVSAVTLYDTTGQNTDGAMTQKAVSDELSKKVSIEDMPIYKSNECKAFAIITRYGTDYFSGPSVISAFECSKFKDLSVGDKILVIGTYFYTDSSAGRYNDETQAMHIATINSFSTESGFFSVTSELCAVGGSLVSISSKRNFAFRTEIPTIDSLLSTTSENAVQNKVVTSAINTAQTTANTAQSTAETANTNAQNAQSTANTALTTANDVLTKLNSTNAFPLNNASVAYIKLSGFGDFLYGDSYTLLLETRGSEEIVVKLSSDGSTWYAFADRIFNSYSKIQGLYYSLSEKALYVKVSAYCTFVNATVISNTNSIGTCNSEVSYSESFIPSDAVEIYISQTIESDSNENGYWVRLYDGTQICIGKNRSVGGGKNTLFTLPKPFIDDTYSAVCSFFTSGNYSEFCSTNTYTTTTLKIFNSNGTTLPVNYIAIGRWK